MARPKKTIEPTVIEPTTVLGISENTSNVVFVPSDGTESQPETKETAFSFYKVMSSDGRVLRWEVAKIMFDAETGYTKRPEIVTSCESEAEALSTFKVNVAQTILKRNR